VALREAVAEWSIDAKPTDSMLEQTMQCLISRHRLPPVEFHPVICGHEVDFRVTDTPVILECDGWAFHGSIDRTSSTTVNETPASSPPAGSCCDSRIER
jgi:very-short-patch-repair endonuclease